jgi:hypothetical protein
MFVIAVDVDEKEVYIDDDSLVARFASNEQVWNTDTQEWELDTEDAALYQEALNLLNTLRVKQDGN